MVQHAKFSYAFRETLEPAKTDVESDEQRQSRRLMCSLGAFSSLPASREKNEA